MVMLPNISVALPSIVPITNIISFNRHKNSGEHPPFTTEYEETQALIGCVLSFYFHTYTHMEHSP